MKRLLLLGLILLLVFLSACEESASAKNTKELRLAHSKTDSHPANQSLEYFAKKVYKETDGEIAIDIYSNEKLGSEEETVELMQAGAIDFVQAGAGNLEQFDETYSIFSLPYLFDDEDHYHKVMDSNIADTFYKSSKNIGFQGLTYYDAGARSFYANKPIEKLSDLKGMKMRVQSSKTILKMMGLFGGAANTMSYGEVYTGLQQGVIDGAENSELNLVSTGHFDAVSDFSRTEHIIAPDILTVSNTTWNKFNEEQKTIIKNAATESTSIHKDIWQEETKDAIEEAKKSGVKFHNPNKKPFAEAVQPLHEIYKNKEDTSQIYKRIREKANE